MEPEKVLVHTQKRDSFVNTSTTLNTNRLYFGVETGVECVVGEVGLRQTHLLQDVHFLLDHWPGSAPKIKKIVENKKHR